MPCGVAGIELERIKSKASTITRVSLHPREIRPELSPSPPISKTLVVHAAAGAGSLPDLRHGCDITRKLVMLLSTPLRPYIPFILCPDYVVVVKRYTSGTPSHNARCSSSVRSMLTRWLLGNAHHDGLRVSGIMQVSTRHRIPTSGSEIYLGSGPSMR
jgi:hypothetical protein